MFKIFQSQHEFVHTHSVVSNGIKLFESLHEIICVEHGFLRGVLYALRAQRVDINRGAQRDKKIAVKHFTLPIDKDSS